MQRRSGFTLVEMLVVITIFLVLAGLVILFLPNVQESQRAALGGTQVQQALQMARSRAVRDQAPRGLRLLPDPANAMYLRSIQFTEQPDDFTVSPAQPGGDLTTPVATDTTKILISGADLWNGSPLDQKLWSVAPGDSLIVLDSGQPHRISDVVSNGTDTLLTLDAPGLPYAISSATRSYRIVRRPRLTGEEPVLLPASVVIDLNTNVTYSSSPGQVNADGSVDILFAPSGRVILPPPGTQFLALWVRDENLNDGNIPAQYYAGEPSIIGVYMHSGLVAASDPSQSGDPYAFLKDGRGTGK